MSAIAKWTQIGWKVRRTPSSNGGTGTASWAYTTPDQPKVNKTRSDSLVKSLRVRGRGAGVGDWSWDLLFRIPQSTFYNGLLLWVRMLQKSVVDHK